MHGSGQPASSYLILLLYEGDLIKGVVGGGIEKGKKKNIKKTKPF